MLAAHGVTPAFRAVRRHPAGHRRAPACGMSTWIRHWIRPPRGPRADHTGRAACAGHLGDDRPAALLWALSAETVIAAALDAERAPAGASHGPQFRGLKPAPMPRLPSTISSPACWRACPSCSSGPRWRRVTRRWIGWALVDAFLSPVQLQRAPGHRRGPRPPARRAGADRGGRGRCASRDRPACRGGLRMPGSSHSYGSKRDRKPIAMIRVTEAADHARPGRAAARGHRDRLSKSSGGVEGA